MEYATSRSACGRNGRELHLLSESFVASGGNSVECPLASTLILIVWSLRRTYCNITALEITYEENQIVVRNYEQNDDETPVLRRDDWRLSERLLVVRTMSDTGYHAVHVVNFADFFTPSRGRCHFLDLVVLPSHPNFKKTFVTCNKQNDQIKSQLDK